MAAKKERRAKDERTDAETPDPPPTISFLTKVLYGCLVAQKG